MKTELRSVRCRRRFFQFLAASPLFASTVFTDMLKVAQGGVAEAANAPGDITSAAQALNVFDLERVAMRNLPIAHAAYLATGVEGDATIQANRDGFRHFQVRAHRLVDTTRIDMSTRLFGATFPVPIFTCPVSSLNAFYPGGDIMVGRATGARKQLQIYPTLANSPLEAVIEARGTPPWFQLYPTREWNVTEALVKHAESTGCSVIVVTVDNPTSV